LSLIEPLMKLFFHGIRQKWYFDIGIGKMTVIRTKEAGPYAPYTS